MHDKWKRVVGTLGVMALISVAVLLLALEEVAPPAIVGSLFALFLLVLVPLLILTTADALGSPLRAPRVSSGGPVPEEFTFEFTSTTKDLLAAHEAVFREAIGIRGWVRWGPLGFGWCALLLGFWTLGSSDVSRMQNVLWIGMGVVLIGFFQVYPFMERRALRRDRTPDLRTKVCFSSAGAESHAEDGSVARVPWESLVECDPQPEGILFSFEFSGTFLLPRRVIGGERETTDLLGAIDAWLGTIKENAIREQLRKERAWGLRVNEFWELIDLLDLRLGADKSGALSALIDELAQREVEEIKGFHDILAEQLYMLDSEELWDVFQSNSESGLAADSEEDFLAARCGVVAGGREVTREVYFFPENLCAVGGVAALVNVAALAYEKKCGEPFLFQPMKDIAMGSNPEGWPNEKAAE